MTLTEIINISGRPGLFRIVAQSPGRIIVENLEDGKKMPVFMRHNFSVLDDIRLYTEEEEMPLKEVFAKIYAHEGGKESIDPKSGDVALAEHLGKIVPDYDKEEVSDRDMKKLFTWYNLLVTKGGWTPDDADKAADDKAASGEEEE